MRRRYLAAVVFSLPLATNALSLASFQPINTNQVPVACGTSYTSQIATCVASDFNNGCSSACVQALLRTEDAVQKACFGLIVNAKSLLGIVQAGGIVEALCVKGASTTTTKTSTTRAAQTTTSRAVLTSDTRTSSRTTTTKPTSTTAVEQDNVVTPTTTDAPADVPAPVATSTRATTTTTRAVADAGNGSGGGSPFDIVNSSGASPQYSERSSTISAVVLGAWALVMVLGR